MQCVEILPYAPLSLINVIVTTHFNEAEASWERFGHANARDIGQQSLVTDMVAIALVLTPSSSWSGCSIVQGATAESAMIQSVTGLFIRILRSFVSCHGCCLDDI
eukprot:scaffold288512_cov15-Prasinocladus_malaysianus.AAC.1